MMRFFILLAFVLYPAVSLAQIANGSACTTAGQTAMNSNTNGITNLLYCNGSTWGVSSVNLGTTVSTCNAANTGMIRLYAKTLQFCDGTNWQAATTTTPTVTNGYFVLSNVGHDGNLGGLSGANTLCRNELSNGNWLGKPATLDTSKVFAWLCDGSSCQNPLPNTDYNYALVGSINYGGGSFTTDASGIGTGESGSWGTVATFGDDYNRQYFTGRNSASDSKWGASNYQNCNGYTTSNSGVTGNVGNSTSGGAGRFSSYGVYCNYTFALICFVNP